MIMNAAFMKLSILLLSFDSITALIIPEEFPTILSLIYSNIPPIKKGTDSRLGVGFRLGEHADFQVIVELGPQKETDPIGDTETKRRRMTTYRAAMRGDLGPWAQSVAKYQTQLKIQSELERMKLLEDKFARLKLENGDNVDHKKASSNDWLTKWSKGAEPTDDEALSTKLAPIETITLNVKNDKRIENGMDQRTHIADGSSFENKMTDLKKLLKQQPTS